MSRASTELQQSSGIVEGFYGPPWTQEERLGAIKFVGDRGLGRYVYAPKDDVFHRERWRELYPAETLSQLGELAASARETGVDFMYAVSPGLSMHFTSEEDHRALALKAAQLWEAGVTSFALLFDDVPIEFHDDGDDATAFGAGEEALGRAHGETGARFLQWWRTLDPHASLLMCPTDYAGCSPSPYRDGLAATLPLDAHVLWTGRDVVVGEVTPSDVEEAAASYQRRLVLWDNFPCNDFDRTRLFAGPLTGRPGDVSGSALLGVLSNPMVEAAPSHFALASLARWAADPASFRAKTGGGRAREADDADADVVGPLVQACSSWPPSATTDQEVAELAAGAAGGDEFAVIELRDRLSVLAEKSTKALTKLPMTELRRALAPWLAAAASMARAGLAACDVLEAGEEKDVLVGLQTRAADALVESEQHFHNVLRDVIPPFVRGVLPSVADNGAAGSSGVAWLVTTEERPEEIHHWRRFLKSMNMSVVVKATLTSDGDVTDLPDVVVLGPRTSEANAVRFRDVPVPVLAMDHQAALGMGTDGGTTMNSAQLDVVEPEHPMASGLAGRVTVHRGQGRFTWVEPAADATVIARDSRGGAAVLTHHPQGSRMA